MPAATTSLPTSALLAFSLGVAGVQTLAELPPGWLLAAAMLLALGLWRSWPGRAWSVAGLAFCVGVSWAVWRAEQRLADRLPAELDGQSQIVSGVIVGLPERLPRGWRFDFEPERAAEALPRRISVSWYGAWPAADEGSDPLPTPRPDQRWRFHLRLRRPHGLANPGGFDFEAWLLQRGVQATAVVRSKPAPELLAERAGRFGQGVHRLREDLRARMLAALPDSPMAGVMVALTVGDQRAIDDATWQVFRRTGVAHLVAISGSHVTLVALVLGGLWAAVWRRCPPLALRWPAQKAGALAGCAAALAYGLIAGLGIPVQRALLMLAVAALALVCDRLGDVGRVLALSLAVVLGFDPWAVLAAGFWLSFAAVAVIMLVLAGSAQDAAWLRACKLQLAISVALLPALLMLFQQFPLVSPLANLLAIPVVNLVAVPLGLLFLLLPWPGLLWPADWALRALMAPLEALSAWPLAVWHSPEPPWGLILLAVLGVGWGLAPRGTPGRLAGWLSLLPLLCWQPARPAEGAFVLTLLDVGQGLAVHVQTARHDLLFDAGPRWGEADAGERVVLPYLRAQGVSRLDRVLISHDDGDHAGGWPSLREALPVGQLLGSAAIVQSEPGAQPCHAHHGGWVWDGVRFEILHPISDDVGLRDNDGSCVLRIAGPGGSALLTGDLEAEGERRLVARQGAALASEVVVAGHHGSRSSSSPAFVAAVRPRWVLYSAGRGNRYGHPHREVLARWAAAGAEGWHSDRAGAIRVEFCALAGCAPTISGWREVRRRYWHAQ